MRLWSQGSGDEKAPVKVELWGTDKGKAQAKGGAQIKGEALVAELR